MKTGLGPTASGQVTVIPNADNYTWTADVLTRAGLPASTNNVGNLLRWITTEKPSAQYWYQGNNPMNLNTQGQPDGFDRYGSLAEGAQATAQFLRMPNYRDVYAVLARDGSSTDFSNAVVRSPWAASHYGVAAAGAAPKYIVAGRGLDYIAQIPLPPKVVAGESLDLGSAGNPLSGSQLAGKGGSLGCTAKGGGISLPLGGGTWGTACQVKALTGGLLVGVGAVVAVVGLVVLAGTTKVGQTALSTVGGPVGKAAGAVTTSRAAAAATSPATAPDRTPPTSIDGQSLDADERQAWKVGGIANVRGFRKSATEGQRIAARGRAA